jgi:tetratricopeptide (TPR) repeat protein
MGCHTVAGLAGALALLLAASGETVRAAETPESGETLQLPGFPPIRIAPGGRVFGPDGPIPPADERNRTVPPKQAAQPPKKLTPEERAAAIQQALQAKPAPAVVRAQALDALFKRLAVATDADEAKGIAATIEHIWLRSESDTADVLMQRALAATTTKQFPLALSLLDKVIALEPDWSEPWNKRATVRYLSGDLDGAMTDIGEVLKREPRHFGALVGMGLMLQRVGLDKQALGVLRRALAIYPTQPEVVKLVEKLTLEVEGRDL